SNGRFPLVFDGSYLCDSFAVNSSRVRNSDPYGLRAFFGLSSSVLSEVLLNRQPVGLIPQGIVQNQDDKRFLQSPQVVVANVHIEDVVRTNRLQGFARLELNGYVTGFDETLFVVSGYK